MYHIYISILSHILHVCRHMMQIYIYIYIYACVYIYKRVYVMHEHVYVYLIISTKYVSTYRHHKIHLDWFWTCAVSVKTLWPTARNSQVINWSLFSTRDGGQCVVAYSKPIEDRKVYSYIYIFLIKWWWITVHCCSIYLGVAISYTVSSDLGYWPSAQATHKFSQSAISWRK